jgi:hypothetical protein
MELEISLKSKIGRKKLNNLKKLGKYNSLKNIKSGKISLSGKNK